MHAGAAAGVHVQASSSIRDRGASGTGMADIPDALRVNGGRGGGGGGRCDSRHAAIGPGS